MTAPRLDLSLPYRPPIDWSSLLRFLALRATPGVELVEHGIYQRTVMLGGKAGTIEVTQDEVGNRLLAQVPTAFNALVPQLEQGIGRIFDLSLEPATVSAHLAGDPVLARAAAAFPGIRVPGSWDGFETSVRAVLGQRISVKAATSLAGRLAARFGEELPASNGRNGLTHLFPTPERLAEADLSGLGLTGQKMRTINSLAQMVAGGRLRFDRVENLEDSLAQLLTLPGVGPWTAHYIAMRALAAPDAFPAGDLILRRAAARAAVSTTATTLSETELTALAERWRPWRAYAAMLLWSSYSQAPAETASNGEPPKASDAV